MKLYLFLFAVSIIVFACTPAQRLSHLKKRHPELFDTIKVIDSTLKIDSAQIQVRELTSTELDSLLEVYCKNSVSHSNSTSGNLSTEDISTKVEDSIRNKVKARIKSICSLESMFKDAKINYSGNGKMNVWAKGNELFIVDESWNKKERDITSTPCNCPTETILGHMIAIWPILVILLIIILVKYSKLI